MPRDEMLKAIKELTKEIKTIRVILEDRYTVHGKEHPQVRAQREHYKFPTSPEQPY